MLCVFTFIFNYCSFCLVVQVKMRWFTKGPIKLYEDEVLNDPALQKPILNCELTPAPVTNKANKANRTGIILLYDTAFHENHTFTFLHV